MVFFIACSNVLLNFFKILLKFSFAEKTPDAPLTPDVKDDPKVKLTSREGSQSSIEIKQGVSSSNEGSDNTNSCR